jgi:hypothetical protein
MLVGWLVVLSVERLVSSIKPTMNGGSHPATADKKTAGFSGGFYLSLLTAY